MDTSARAIEGSPPKIFTPCASRRVDMERLEAQLAEWTASIAQYRARAKRTETSDRLEFERITDELQRRRNDAGAQVQQLKGATDAHWDRLKADLDRSWEDLRGLFRMAATRF